MKKRTTSTQAECLRQDIRHRQTFNQDIKKSTEADNEL